MFTTKYTIEDMKKLAKERGGECLSDEYINMKTNLMTQYTLINNLNYLKTT